jgi:hypothetical protein
VIDNPNSGEVLVGGQGSVAVWHVRRRLPSAVLCHVREIVDHQKLSLRQTSAMVRALDPTSLQAHLLTAVAP